MSRHGLRVSAGAIFLAAAIYYIGDIGEISAVLLPVIVHELGHIMMLRVLGLRIGGFRAELRGFCIEYNGYTGAVGHALVALAGPLAGLSYAMAASFAGARLDSGWLCVSSGVSLLLSIFNLLPALPLDGGRIVSNLADAFLGNQRGAKITELISLLVGIVLLCLGIWLMLRGQGVALLIAAIWVLMYQESGASVARFRQVI